MSSSLLPRQRRFCTVVILSLCEQNTSKVLDRFRQNFSDLVFYVMEINTNINVHPINYQPRKKLFNSNHIATSVLLSEVFDLLSANLFLPCFLQDDLILPENICFWCFPA